MQAAVFLGRFDGSIKNRWRSHPGASVAGAITSSSSSSSSSSSTPTTVALSLDRHLRTQNCGKLSCLYLLCPEMAASLDMALDDIIRNNRQHREQADRPQRGRGRRSAAGAGGPARRFPNRASFRDSMPYTAWPPMPVMEPFWEQHMSGDGGGMADHGTGIKLYISNLDYGVTNDDLMHLFSPVGDLLRYSIHCDKSGRSKGTAEVVFAREADAVAAIKRYNNVQLDGKPMMIEIVGKNLISPTPLLPTPNSILGRPPGIPARGQRIGAGHSPGSGIGRGLPWDRSQAKARQSKPSAEDLDAELERYHSEAVRTKRPALV